MLRCYGVTVLRCYGVTVLRCYGVTVLRCYGVTVLRCYGVTVLRCYGVTVLRCYGVTVLRCYGVTVLRCYGVTVLRCYGLTAGAGLAVRPGDTPTHEAVPSIDTSTVARTVIVTRVCRADVCRETRGETTCNVGVGCLFVKHHKLRSNSKF